MVLQHGDIPQHIETKVSNVSVGTQTRKLHSKKFECDVCGRMLSTNFNLQRHMKNFHIDRWIKKKSQQRPLYCPQGAVVVDMKKLRQWNDNMHASCCRSRTHSPCYSAEAYSCPLRVCSFNATCQKQQSERGLPPPPQQQHIVHLHI